MTRATNSADRRGDRRVGTLQVVAAAFDPHVLDRGRDRRRPLDELVGRTERVVRAGDEQTRHRDRRQVLDAQLVGLARRVQRIADQHETGEPGDGAGTVDVGGDHRRHPPAHRTPAHHDGPRRRLKAARSSRIEASSFGARSGARRPSRRYGKSKPLDVGRRRRGPSRSGAGWSARGRSRRPDTAARVGFAMIVVRRSSASATLSPASSTGTRRGPRRDRSSPSPRRVSAPPWSGWTSRIRSRNCAVTSRFEGVLPPSSKPRMPIAHPRGSASASSVNVCEPARWAISAEPIGPRHRAAFCRTGPILRRCSGASRSAA